MADALFNIRQALYLGNFSVAISEGATASIPLANRDQIRAERDLLVYKAHIGLNQYDLVIRDIQESASPSFQAIRILASYLKAVQGEGAAREREQALQTLQQALSDEVTRTNPDLLLTAGLIYSHEEQFDQALKCLHTQTTLDMSALMAETYLRMSRVDLAEKVLKQMQQVDDESTLTQLTAAKIYLAIGGSKIAEASYIYNEHCEKYGETVLVLNGLAVCSMSTQKFEEAEKLLLEAMGKRSNDAETLINLVVCANHLKKPQELINRYVTQLKSASPNHPWVRRLQAAESNFERVAASFA